MIALSILFIFGILLMLAGGLNLARIAHREIQRANENEESREFWRECWMNEIEENIELFAKIGKLEEDLLQLEQGTIEIEENYQQELLDEYDKVQQLSEKSNYYHTMTSCLEQIRLDHEVFCLPSLTADEIHDTSIDDEDPPIYYSLVFDRIG